MQPARFSGQRLALPAEIPVQGFASIRIEIYLRPPGGAEQGQVSISSGGTIVYDEVAQLDAADFHHPPWLDHRLCGLVEFPDFEVSPGTRRGVFPNQAAFAFAAALRSVEPAILEQVKEAEARTAAALEADVLRQLEKAFRDLPRLAPEYDFFAVRAHDSAPLGGAPGDGRGEVARARTGRQRAAPRRGRDAGAGRRGGGARARDRHRCFRRGLWPPCRSCRR